MNPMKFFWGLVIALIGFTLLGTQQGWVEDDVWLRILFLWPVILIVWGLSLIIKNTKILTFLILLIFILSVLFVSTYTGVEYRLNNLNGLISLTSDEEKSFSESEIMINLGASKIKIDSLSDEKSNNNLLEYEAKGYSKIVTEYLNFEKNPLDIKIYENIKTVFLFSNLNREFSAHLSKNPPISLTLNCGASAIDLDLKELKITTLNLDSGASSARINFGEKVDKVNVYVKSGASNLIFNVPSESGVKLVFSSGKATNSLTDNIGMKKNGDIYLTSNYENAKNKIEIDIESGVTNVTLNQN